MGKGLHPFRFFDSTMNLIDRKKVMCSYACTQVPHKDGYADEVGRNTQSYKRDF
jgi:hypothetical protein